MIIKRRNFFFIMNNELFILSLDTKSQYIWLEYPLLYIKFCLYSVSPLSDKQVKHSLTSLQESPNNSLQESVIGSDLLCFIFNLAHTLFTYISEASLSLANGTMDIMEVRSILLQLQKVLEAETLLVGYMAFFLIVGGVAFLVQQIVESLQSIFKSYNNLGKFFNFLIFCLNTIMFICIVCFFTLFVYLFEVITSTQIVGS